MALEDLTGASKFIDDLVNTNPDGATDYGSTLDNHLRGIKNVLLNTFPNIDAAVTSTPAQLNAIGQTQTDLDTLEATVDALVTVPPGAVMPYAGASAPADWLLCDGSSKVVADYTALHAIIGYTYGGSGLNFNLPDLQGRVVAGKDDMSGVSQNNLTSPVNGDVLGATGGAETAAAELKSHTHSVSGTAASNGSHSHTISYDQGYTPGSTLFTAANNATSQGTLSTNSGGAHTHSVSGTASAPAGTGSSHTNVQPTFILNYIIKT